MLANMAKEHNAKQQIRKEMQEKRKNEAVVAAHSLANSVVEHLNRKVSHAYTNQKKIDVESKRMQNHSANLAKLAEDWISLIDSFNATLKQVGDVQSWSRAIDNDATVIANTLHEVFDAKVGTVSTTQQQQKEQQKQQEEQQQQQQHK